MLIELVLTVGLAGIIYL